MATLVSSSTMTSFTACLFFLLVVLSSAIEIPNSPTCPPKRTEEEVRAMFESWLVENKKNYNALGEKEVRFQIFKDNLMFIDEHNAENHSYRLGLTLFADLTNEEYRSKYLRGFLPNTSALVTDNKFENMDQSALADSVDWRTTGAIGPVLQQGECGSCWAFSSAAAIEAVNYFATGKYIQLSPQQLVDCETKYSHGCDGGIPPGAFVYVINNGITSAAAYPYRGYQGPCRRAQPVATIDDYGTVARNDENALKAAVAKRPVVVAVDSKARNFQLYKGGLYEGPCGTQLDHAILNVGYGIASGRDYWIVKNSWGTNWGDGGFGYLRRNIGSANGICGIAMDPSYPIKYRRSELQTEGDKTVSI